MQTSPPSGRSFPLPRVAGLWLNRPPIAGLAPYSSSSNSFSGSNNCTGVDGMMVEMACL